MTDDESVAAAAQQMREEFGRLDVLVNTPASPARRPMSRTDLNGNSGYQSVQEGRMRS